MWMVSVYFCTNVYLLIMYGLHIGNIVMFDNGSFEVVYEPAIGK